MGRRMQQTSRRRVQGSEHAQAVAILCSAMQRGSRPLKICTHFVGLSTRIGRSGGGQGLDSTLKNEEWMDNLQVGFVAA